MFNSEWTLTKILNRLEDLSVEKVYKYNKQECINSEPTLQAGSQNLEEYRCTLPLHANFCNPKRVIDIVTAQQSSQESFIWIYRGACKGTFVIESIETIEKLRIKDVLVFTELHFNLIKVPDNTEFEQQIKGQPNYDNLEKYSEDSNRIKDFLNEIKTSTIDNLKNGISGNISFDNLSDAAQRVLNSTVLGVFNEIEGGNIAKIYDTCRNYISQLQGNQALSISDIGELSEIIQSIPNSILSASWRAAV